LSNPFVPKYIISLIVRDSTILELAPTITAIVLAGKVARTLPVNWVPCKLLNRLMPWR
jgi:phospholipid/cholesterol/gamma-HCH transport system permease protein